ncbi:UPF0481 protein At3g47200 [Quercus suber]|uniref:UPF0481 protein At3g47200 n=1 Tax=Quercus suber TaxID=58331 RepID=UPI000CE26C05|nr:UPF0481 protein At3g47200-like [Quercus suber]POE79069.1 upf0481 protein [Quercus suber]
MAENEADSAAIDIEGLAHSIEDWMSQDRFMSPNCCIFKTPTILRDLNQKAYVPGAFSIGPFHHGRPEFEDTEKIKSEYLHGLISRSPYPETILRELINSVKNVERKARECYAGPIVYSPDEFVKILVIDGCFIIELLRKMAYVELREENDPIFSMACMPQFICHDLILLENQVPWVVLELLFNKTLDPTPNNVNKPLIEMVKSFIASFLIKPPSGHPPIQDIKHIVDVGRKLLVSSIAGEEGHLIGPDWTLLPSATSLVEAGVKIKRGESADILDLKYDNGVLEIPPLKIDETTETLFRNIISFEQCYPNCEARFTSYAMLLDNLINTAKDVDILSENKIIKNWLNPEDAIPFFNKLYYNTSVKKMYYQSLCKKVNEYCNRRWPSWRTVLVRNYFNTPWAILSTAAAVILLILTSVQTWYAVFEK